MQIFNSLRTRVDNIYQRITSAMFKFYRSYLAMVCACALIGYGLILLFPLLMIMAGINLYEILSTGETIDWKFVAIWSVILILSTLLSYRSTRFKASIPVGLTLHEEKAPEIFKLVKRFQDHFKRPAIQRIVITTNYEIDIVKMPKWAIPVWSTNIMVIGLPVLLCHSPKQFECMVARRIGQFSKRNNLFTNWLYQLRAIWKQYSLAYAKQKAPDNYLLKWLFDAYAFMYKSISVNVARKDELNADTYSMELFIHDDVRETITANAVYQYYLKEQFWPAIEKIASIKKQTSITPYQNMASAIQTKLNEETLSSLINKVFEAQPDRKDPIPSLKDRLENIGHDTPHLSQNTGSIAATQFLGDLTNGVINLIDKLWQKDNMEKQKIQKK